MSVYGTETPSQLALWLASLYDISLDLYNMQSSIENIPSVKFERRREKQKLPAFLYAFRKTLMSLVDKIWEGQLSGEVRVLRISGVVQCTLTLFFRP